MLRRARTEERGSVLAILAVGVPTFILLAALALDFGNWYAHKRSLQNRVDAAAFAAGVAYGYKFPQCTANSALADQITAVAEQYAGKAPSTYNDNAGGNLDVQVNPDGPNPCQPHPTGDYSSPDGTIWTDVHVTQTVPSLFGNLALSFIPSITSNARVAVMQLQSMTGFRPLAIANAGYTSGQCATVTWRDEDGNTVGSPVPLTLGSGNHWTGTDSFTMPATNVHADVTLGDCTDTTEQITYPDVGFVGKYDQSGGNEPQFQGILVDPSGGCDARYISRRAAPCDFAVTVFADFRGTNYGTQVTVDINGQVVLLTAPPPPQPIVAGTQTFTGTVTGLLPGSGEGSGPNGTIPVKGLEGTYTDTAGPPGNTQTTLFGLGGQPVQSIMAGDDRHEGPITDFKLSQPEAQPNDPVSQQIDLILEPLASAGPAMVLRARGGGALSDHTLNGALDCADSQTFAEQIARGCTSSFQVHPPTVCSGAPPSPPDCIAGLGFNGTLTGAGGTYDNLWAPGGDCSNPASQNHWADYPDIPRGDPRLITVPVTRIGSAFSPGANHPVIGFAAFYVTGWTGMPSGCGDPVPPATASLGNEVWGHFIRFVEPSSVGAPKTTGVAANDQCDPNSTDIAACIATLVQ